MTTTAITTTDLASDASARLPLTADEGARHSAGTPAAASARRRLLPWVAIASAALLSAPAQAIAPDGRASEEPYAYPAVVEDPEVVPSGWWRAPAAALDLLVIRPVMLGGLAAGAAFFVIVLPVQAAASAADESAAALLDQAKSTFTRPLGRF